MPPYFGKKVSPLNSLLEMANLVGDLFKMFGVKFGCSFRKKLDIFCAIDIADP
jgi:hypothetical protein